MTSTLPATITIPQHAAMPEHDALPPGTRFGELEILRVLGVGGFGIVYLAQDHALERSVALKEYMPSSLAGRGKGQMVSVRSGAHAETYAMGLRSFVNEARLLAQFNHPSLVKVYRFWEENGTAYMVMPYLQGRTLRDVRQAMSSPPTEGWVRSVVTPLLDALELLHREDVYHRDIAPDNVLLPPGEMPVLLDFGAARRAMGDQTQTFTAILKPSYAPIEQYAEVAQLRQGPWTDLYALGAVVYYLLHGAAPPPATARAVQDDPSLMRQEDNPDISAHFLAGMEWALAVRPADRPQNIAALREVLEGRSTVPPRARGTPTHPPRTVIMAAPEAGSFAPTAPFDGDRRDEHTQPMTRPPRATPPAGMPWLGTTTPVRTRPETTVMPSTPTMDTPLRSRLWGQGARVAAGLAGVMAVAAAGWAVGNRQASAVVTPALAASAPILVQAAPAASAAQPVVEALRAVPSQVASKVSALGSAASAALRIKPKEKSPREAVPGIAPADAEPASPRQACGSRTFLALAVCMEEQCERPRFRAHAECEKVREIVERRRRGENG